MMISYLFRVLYHKEKAITKSLRVSSLMGECMPGGILEYKSLPSWYSRM